jgi:hypothetical protein
MALGMEAIIKIGDKQYSIFVEDKCLVSRELLEEIRDWLSHPQSTGGRFPMETHRAESEGVEHLLSGIVDALNEA